MRIFINAIYKNICIALYKSNSILDNLKIENTQYKTIDEVIILILKWIDCLDIKQKDIKYIIIACEDNDLKDIFKITIFKYFSLEATFINHNNIHKKAIQKNKQLSILNYIISTAAHYLYDKSKIVINYDQLNTYNLLNKDGQLLDSITCVGICKKMEILCNNTALLFGADLKMPKNIPQNTDENISAGMLYSLIGETKYIIQILKNKIDKTPKIIVCGNIVDEFDEYKKTFDIINHNLIFEGMRILFELDNT